MVFTFMRFGATVKINRVGRFGRRGLSVTVVAQIEPVNSRDDVADYCAKYVAKEGSWWNVKLLGQRHQAFKDFKLE
jgi:hypothetical protein